MEKGIKVGKILTVQAIITIAALLILSFLVWKMGLSKEGVKNGVLGIYVVVNFIGGFLLGKGMGKRKFLWGVLIGTIYFLLVMSLSFLVHKAFCPDANHAIRVLIFSVIGGMLGGMLG